MDYRLCSLRHENALQKGAAHSSKSCLGQAKATGIRGEVQKERSISPEIHQLLQ